MDQLAQPGPVGFDLAGPQGVLRDLGVVPDAPVGEFHQHGDEREARAGQGVALPAPVGRVALLGEDAAADQPGSAISGRSSSPDHSSPKLRAPAGANTGGDLGKR